MILAAEKANIHAELVFYKNELAKLCLSTGTRFPVFRQPESSNLILMQEKSSVLKDETNLTSATPTTVFYETKQPVSSEDRYAMNSQLGEIEDQVSTTIS